MSGYSAGLAAYKAVFELSPILLTNGIATEFPGFAIPIIALTETLNFPFSILSGSQALSLDNFFAHYQPLPGASVIQQQLGRYPFANSTIAANAVITMPNLISMIMICPVQNKLGWLEKLAIMEALIATLKLHNAKGGTYVVATPSHIFTDCVMIGMHDASAMVTKQVQNAWQLDFERPLLTKTQVDSVLGGLMKVIKTGSEVIGNSVSGIGASIATPVSAAISSVSPAAAASTAAQTTAAAPVNTFPIFAPGKPF